MYDLTRFGFHDMMDCRSRLRHLFDEEPATVEEAAEQVVRFFRSAFVDGDGRPAFLLARQFKVHPYADLDEGLKAFVRTLEPAADTLRGLRCLVLLATAGDEPAWNVRHLSRGHRAIPLTSERVVEEAPMIAQLLHQLGLSASTVLRPDPSLMLDVDRAQGGLFYVPRASGSPHIVAQQEFVEPYGVESVIGFGWILAHGDLFATLLFSRVTITKETADLFEVVGLNLKLALLSVARKPVFSGLAPVGGGLS